MDPNILNADVVKALADLADRCGACNLDVGFVRDDVPVEEAGWYAHVQFRGGRLISDEHRSPSAAALGLAEKILSGGRCRCGKTVTLNDNRSGCRWRLVGPRWEPGCNAAPIRMPGALRGDVAGMHDHMNRAARRAAKKGKS